MKNFLLVFKGGIDPGKNPAAYESNMSLWNQWIGSLAAEGKVVGAERLASDGILIKGKSKQVVDGPYTESKDMIGGYLLINAPDQKTACDIAMGCPIYENDGAVEVREVVKM
jgi:hypothetical protein